MTDRNTNSLPRVPTMLYWQSRLFARTAGLWRQLARLESAALREAINRSTVQQPIYIAGVPRAGSTMLTEFVAAHPAVACHRYSDFPNIYTPYWRNWLAKRTPGRPPVRVERSHGDRIMVSNDSPEAVEEVLWMQFFEHLHDPESNQILDGYTSNPEFERFYTDHVRKLLLVHNRSRYLAKGNYNTSRLRYILKLFPDARFVVPVRNPVSQVASLVKQDRLFQRADRRDPRISRQLGMSGHFEFGPGHLPVNLGTGDAQRISSLWQQDRLAAGWALYWSSVYRNILDQIRENRALKHAVKIIHYEDLCASPQQVLESLLEHVRLETTPAQPALLEFSRSISEPSYYQHDFTDDELSDIAEMTGEVALELGNL